MTNNLPSAAKLEIQNEVEKLFTNVKHKQDTNTDLMKSLQNKIDEQRVFIEYQNKFIEQNKNCQTKERLKYQNNIHKLNESIKILKSQKDSQIRYINLLINENQKLKFTHHKHTHLDISKNSQNDTNFQSSFPLNLSDHPLLTVFYPIADKTKHPTKHFPKNVHDSENTNHSQTPDHN